jgi:hypothetical protein
MSEGLGRLEGERKTGEEPFRIGDKDLGFDLLSFWRWMASDLVSNATRGRLAEYIVARALGLAEKDVRDEWAAFDLKTKSNLKIEVKSAAYVQSWHQTELSKITFLVPATRAWDANTNKQSMVAQRQAEIYRFALLAHRDKATIKPLDVNQWEFYVLPTTALNKRTRSQHSITLKSLKTLAGKAVTYSELSLAIETAGRGLE